LRDLFEPFGAVEIRRMFGGQGIFRDGRMFGLVSDERIFLKSDDETRGRFQAAGSRAFTFRKNGSPVETSYWSLPDEALDDPDSLKVWADLAYQAALSVTPKRQRKRESS
jgi:DNA transformation protein